MDTSGVLSSYQVKSNQATHLLCAQVTPVDVDVFAIQGKEFSRSLTLLTESPAEEARVVSGRTMLNKGERERLTRGRVFVCHLKSFQKRGKYLEVQQW